jgi:translocation and assembly module TamB
LQLRGENMLVADLPEYRVVASPDLTFRIDGRQIDVTGGVTIPSAGIHPVQFSSTVRASDDAQYVGEHPAEKAGRFTVNSNVRIAMGDDVRIDAFGLQGRIRGAVDTMVRTGETALGRGELTVEEGRYDAYGQKLAINRGRLLFDSSSLDDPGLDIEARREVETVTVGLNVRGTLREPRLTFFSDPSMAQTQIVSYLLTGKSIDTMRGGDRMTMDSARSSLAYQGGGVLASQLGRRLGIEEVGVESSIDSAGESNTSLVLGKFLSPRLFISYGISLTESINTLKLRYTISDRWIFRTEAGEDQSADLEYTIEK